MTFAETGNSDVDATSGRVDVKLTTTVRYMSSSKALHAACRVNGDVLGCTDFPAERLHCSCSALKEKWVIDSEATIPAVIYLSGRESDPRLLMHERLHFTDLERGLRERLARVAAVHYESLSACETVAGAFSAPSFLRDVMNNLRAASNAKYHCNRLELRPQVRQAAMENGNSRPQEQPQREADATLAQLSEEARSSGQ
jgi:hypothetical protein